MQGELCPLAECYAWPRWPYADSDSDQRWGCSFVSGVWLGLYPHNLKQCWKYTFIVHYHGFPRSPSVVLQTGCRMVLYLCFWCHTSVRPSPSSGTSETMFLFVLHSHRSCRSLIPGQYWTLTHPRSLPERIVFKNIHQNVFFYFLKIFWVVLTGSLTDLNTLLFLFLYSFLHELQQVIIVHLQSSMLSKMHWTWSNIKSFHIKKIKNAKL